MCVASAEFQLPAQNFLKGGDIFGKFMYLSGAAGKKEERKIYGEGKVSGQNNSKVFTRNIVFCTCVWNRERERDREGKGNRELCYTLLLLLSLRI